MTATVPRIRVWDWPVRLFHWSVAILVPLMWWTAEQGAMDWHRRLGVALLFVILFRLIWGVVGSETARFSRFLPGPSALLSYPAKLFQRPYMPSFGHNPLGALSVVALLAALSFQVGSGLFSVDVDGLESGPLASLVDFGTGRDIADIHETSFNILLALVALHLTAIAVYAIALRTNLVGPMVTGNRPRVSTDPDTSAPIVAPWGRVGLSAGLAAAIVWAVLSV